MESELLTIRQACRILNVHPDTLRRWEKGGRVKSIRVGSRKDRRYKVGDIQALVSIENGSETFETTLVPKSQNPNQLRKVVARAKAVIFDVGDTLMAPYPSRGHVFAEQAYLHGYNLDPEKLERNFHEMYDAWEREKLLSDFTIRSTDKVRENLYSKLNSDVLIQSGFPQSKRKEAIEIGNKIYHTITSDPSYWQIYPGAKEFLKFLKAAGKTLAVLDNWNHYLENFITKSEIRSYFKIVVSGGAMQKRKPDPEIFQYTLKKLNIKASEAIYIGNRFVDDVVGPKSVGITPILFDNSQKYLGDNSLLKFYFYRELVV